MLSTLLYFSCCFAAAAAAAVVADIHYSVAFKLAALIEFLHVK